LQKQFSLYFKVVDISKYEWLTNPYFPDVSGLTRCEQEQLLDMYCEGSLKDMLDADKLPQCRVLVRETTQVY